MGSVATAVLTALLVIVVVISVKSYSKKIDVRLLRRR